MADDAEAKRALLSKIEQLPMERLAELEAFVNKLAAEAVDRSELNVFTALSAPAFQAIWDNADDAVYDEL